jgi:hypothetical protein
MKRISTATKAADLFGAGKHGWRDGDLSISVIPTDGEAAWFNNLQEEVANVIEANGITLDGNVRTQLYQAIQLMIAASASNDYKASVRAATTINITTLAGGAPNTLDGVTLVANDRILVKDQTTGSQNGIYYVATLGTGANGTWTRATDADGLDELTSGAILVVEQGSLNADRQWTLTTDGAITIGTTALLFECKDGSIPQNARIADYTLQLSDANKHLLHPSSDVTGRTFTIPANSSAAFPIGTAITFVNQNAAGGVTIAITTDTMRLAGAGTTGSRTLAANGIATALKITATEWILSGSGVT